MIKHFFIFISIFYGITTNYSDFTNFYIIHYFSKSTEEFIKKLMRGSAYHGYKIEKKKNRIKEYFNINDITLTKIDYIEKETKINCSLYRKQLIYYHI